MISTVYCLKSNVVRMNNIFRKSLFLREKIPCFQRKTSAFKIQCYTTFGFRTYTSVKKQNILASVKNVRFYAKKKLLPFERELLASQSRKDVLLFTNKSNRFYNMIVSFGLAQFVMWMVMSITLYDAPVVISKEELEELKEVKGYFAWFGRVSQELMSDAYKSSRTVAFLFIGSVMLLMSMAYPSRIIRNLWLIDSGNFVKFTTFAPIGRDVAITVPLSNVSSMAARTDSPTHIPVKVRGKRFYYLIDKNSGTFHDKQTFDYTVGLSRFLKK